MDNDGDTCRDTRNNRRVRVGVLFGGKSAEHEVSVQSAKSVVEAIDKDKYEVVLIGIDKTGQWYLSDIPVLFKHADNPALVKLNGPGESVTLVSGEREAKLINLTNSAYMEPLDVVFPVMHGPYGEDGTIQGLLKLANVPFVGAGVLGSAVGMDKDVMKRLLRDAGLPIPLFLVFDHSSVEEIGYDDVASALGLPFFVKPANLGSSVGVHKVTDKKSFWEAVNDAFKYDHKIIIEEFIDGREIECSVLGDRHPIASVPGEIIPQHEWYSYATKYIDDNGALLEIPAKLPEHVISTIQKLAVTTFKALCCEGMGRVDFFLRGEDEVLVNEINTIPGFTKISMYPKLWEATGIPYPELIDRLIQLAIERHKRTGELRTNLV